MIRRQDRRFALGLLAAAVGALSLVGLTLAASPNVRQVEPQANVQDPDQINTPTSKLWVLDFRFKDPRIIKVAVPGRGQRVCFYLWYQVINNTGEPRTFIPDFELVTQDTNKVYHDQVLPRVQDEVRKLEDPTDYYKIKNSVTIAAQPIPPSLPNAAPRPVTGVAIWDDVDPDSNHFAIFVSGLSNGWSITDPIPPDTKPVVRRKTLQLNFRRTGDRYLQGSNDIRFVPPAQWIYRGSKLSVPGLSAPAARSEK
jgi:hypothetical protein